MERWICPALLDLDQITAPDRSTPQHRGINADVDLVMLGRRAQDARIFGQISLGQRRHDTAGARAGDVQTDFVANRQGVADPVILDEVLFARGRLDYNVWPKPPHLEA